MNVPKEMRPFKCDPDLVSYYEASYKGNQYRRYWSDHWTCMAHGLYEEGVGPSLQVELEDAYQKWLKEQE